VKRRLGPDFPVFVRLGAHDDMPGGVELDEACAVARQLADAGVCLIDVSGGLQGSGGAGKGPAYFVPYARAIKEVVPVPVLVAGGLGDVALAQRAIAEGWADLVGVGRAMLNDADWAQKAIQQAGSAPRA